MQRGGSVYILTTANRRVLYTGVTSDIVKRISEHKLKIHPNSFTARYNCTMLVYYNSFSRIEEAIAEEKRIKAGSRQQKEQLINAVNYEWRDLWDDIMKEW
ncbi:MAG: excinuclease ABC subunit C [Bacteroidetes bacterium 46-16]|nr:MAG: excinuclease ABC subunit C [Bacteroidetes bacterium 46-16]